MNDSINWLLPNFKAPSFLEGLIAISMLIAGLLIQRYIIEKVIQWQVAFLEKRGEAFFARTLEQFSRSIRNAFMITVLFFTLSYLFDISFFTNPKTAKLFLSFMFYFFFKGIHDVLDLYTDFPERFSVLEKEHDILTPFFLRIVRVLVMIFALFAIASLWDFNLNGFLTGIGLTGVAMAFGIRDTLAHIFGGMSVALDKPFQIGDWVATEDHKIEGIIEDINLRSTLIQTGDKGLVYVPNAYLVNRPLYNLSKRTKRKCEFHFELSTANEEQLIRDVCEQIREQIALHKQIEKDIIHVAIDAFRPHSFRLLIRFFIDTNDTGELLAVQQDILFAMHQIMKEADVQPAHSQQELWIHS